MAILYYLRKSYTAENIIVDYVQYILNIEPTYLNNDRRQPLCRNQNKFPESKDYKFKILPIMRLKVLLLKYQLRKSYKATKILTATVNTLFLLNLNATYIYVIINYLFRKHQLIQYFLQNMS